MPLLGQDQEALLGLLQNNSGGVRPTFGGGLQSIMKGLGGNDFALAMLANSGYSPNKQSFGQIVGNSALQARQMGAQRSEDELMRRYREAQIASLPNQSKTTNIRDYEFLKSLKNPQDQSQFNSLLTSGSGGDPSEVRAYKYWASLSDAEKQDFLKLKRNVGSDYAIETVNGVPTVVYKPAAGGPGAGGGTPLVTPLTNLTQQVAGASAIKQGEAQASAVGKGLGEIQSGIQTKGSNASNVLGMVGEARKVLKDATGSMGGAAIDATAGAFGVSTKGAQAISKLKVLQAGMMLNMPRMEGPQSDRDVQLYREAAASLGEPNVPAETKAAALDMIEQLQQKYQERAAGISGKQLSLDEIRAKYGRKP